jgi:hypothetical protein
MKKEIDYAQFLIISLLLTFLSCNRNNTTQDNRAETIFVTLGQKEEADWNYYQAAEKEYEINTSITEETINEYIQSLIKKGLIERPVIFVDTENGTEPRYVDYEEYKVYRKNNPIDLGRLFIFEAPKEMSNDSVLNVDSIGIKLLMELKVDSIERSKNK